jgi:hypothetical protein
MRRAEEHFDAVKAELIAWKESQPYIVTKQSDSEGKRHGLIVRFNKWPPLDRLAILAGDCVHNLRAALDSLVYAAAIRDSGANPPPNFKALQFPITDDSVAFGIEQKRRLVPLSAHTQARIERAQPYNRSHADLPPLLRILADFDNIDKHRLLNLVIANVSQGKFSFTPPRDQLIFVPPTIEYLIGAIESGAEFAWFTLNPPQRDVHYNYEATFVISVAHAAGPSGRVWGELGYILEVLIAEVRRIIDTVIL